MVQSARQHFYANLSVMKNKVKYVSCLLVASKMWGASFNTLTADDMYSCHHREKLPQQVPTQLSLKPKTFLDFLLHFRNLHKTFSTLKKNINFITLRFPELKILENVVTWMLEISCFRTPFGSKRVKGRQAMVKSARQHFYANFSFMSHNVRRVSCLLVRSEMWRPSFNTLTADHKYSCHNREKFPKQVPTQVSSKP